MSSVESLLREGTDRLRAAGSETPRLDAELLLGEVLGVDRTRIVTYGETIVGDGQAAAYETLLGRRAAGEPVAYIRGIKEFHGLALSVDARALIPRPETERLVELAEREVADRLVRAPRPVGVERLAIIDVGTGCGAVAVALAVALRRRRMLDHVRILATDVSPEALELAAANVAGHVVADAVSLRLADLMPSGFEVFEVILANLPYVRSDAIPGLPIATSFEPVIALDGGPDGLDVIRRLLTLLPGRLAFGGVALIEIGADQGEAVGPVVDGLLPGWPWRVETDLAGLPRVLRIDRPTS